MIPVALIREAVERLGADGFIAYPTETVWGLGACADRAGAVERLMGWKGRASDAPLAVLVDSVEAVAALDCEIEDSARRLMAAFWPGPLTLVLPCSRRFAPGVARADGALGLRCSPHPLAYSLSLAVAAAGLGPLTSTSLNRSGSAPAIDLASARSVIDADAQTASLDDPLLVFSEGCDAGAATPSSVVDCTGPRPKILRLGAIDRERLEDTWAQ
jgi:L-threonylcarbamoyladenylate synthase